MTTTVQLNFCDSSALAATNWNTVIGGTTTGTKVASGSVIDSAGSVVSGVSVSVTNAYDVTSDTGGATYIAGSYPDNVKLSYWRLDTAGSSGNTVISGLGAGTAVVYIFSGRDATGPRITDWTVTGASGSTSTGATDGGYDATTPANEFVSSSITLGSSDSITITGTVRTGSSYGHLNGVKIVFTPSAPAVISSPTATSVTQTTATIGCTTDTASGTLYYVASSTQANITGITAAQVVAGQSSSGGALARNGSNAVSSTSPSIAATGFTAGTQYWYAEAQSTGAGNSNVLSTGTFTTTSSAPTISSISDSTPNYLGSLTITGTNFPTAQSGSAAITIGGAAQTVTWNTATSCSISSVDIGTNKYGTSVNIIVTDASGNASSGYATTFSPRSGGAYVDLSGTMASSGVRLTSTPDLAAGDQIEYYGATGGTIPADVTVNSDGTYDVSSSVTAFVFRVNNGAGWGTAATETIGTLATISSATPSGAIGTQTTATVGATTDTVSGTFYYVLSATQGHITGVTAAQIKAGNNSSGTAAQKSGSSSVISSTPSVSVTGLTANTTYYYAVVQNTTAGDSNVISSGVFSTAAAPVTSNERNIHQAIIQPIYKPIGRAI